MKLPLFKFSDKTKGFAGALLFIGSFIIIAYFYNEIDQRSNIVEITTYKIGEIKHIKT